MCNKTSTRDYPINYGFLNSVATILKCHYTDTKDLTVDTVLKRKTVFATRLKYLNNTNQGIFIMELLKNVVKAYNTNMYHYPFMYNGQSKILLLCSKTYQHAQNLPTKHLIY